MIPQIFINYAVEDQEHARCLYSDLSRAGERVWFDKECLLPGQNWKYEIQRAIKESRYFIALLSKKSIQKAGYVQRELKEAIERLKEFPNSKIYLIPARIDACDLKSTELEYLQWVDLFTSWEDGVAKILKAVSSERKKSESRRGIYLEPSQLNIENITPRILNITPISDLSVLLGLKHINDIVNIEGCWRDPHDGDVVYFQQKDNRVVGFYDYGSSTEKVGVYIGFINNSVFEYHWKWIDGSYEGQGRMTLSPDGQRLSGEWWYGKQQGQVEHVGYSRVSGDMPSWLSKDDFFEHEKFLRNKVYTDSKANAADAKNRAAD